MIKLTPAQIRASNCFRFESLRILNNMSDKANLAVALEAQDARDTDPSINSKVIDEIKNSILYHCSLYQ